MLTAAELKPLLKTHGLRLTKRLGQHHLIDARLIQELIERCRISKADTVVEIGAGLGALTEPLADQAGQVIAIEVDRAISGLLKQRLSGTSNVSVRCEDILEFPWTGLTDAVVVGAIPYHITSPILVSLCEARAAIRRAILVVQEEVSDRLAAAPGTKAYGRLSLLAQYCWKVKPLLRVPRSAFFPQPEVDSCCVELTKQAQPPARVVDEAVFFQVVKAAFSHRRKTLANCLTELGQSRLQRDEAASLIKAAGLPASVRGEALSLDQFAFLTNLISHGNPS